MFNLQSRHRLLWSDGATNLKLNIQELLTKTQANSIFTISVRTSPSCQQLLNFHLNIWQSKTGFLLSVLLQDGIQAYCWVELQSLKLGSVFCFRKSTNIHFKGKKNPNKSTTTTKTAPKKNQQKEIHKKIKALCLWLKLLI